VRHSADLHSGTRFQCPPQYIRCTLLWQRKSSHRLNSSRSSESLSCGFGAAGLVGIGFGGVGSGGVGVGGGGSGVVGLSGVDSGCGGTGFGSVGFAGVALGGIGFDGVALGRAGLGGIGSGVAGSADGVGSSGIGSDRIGSSGIGSGSVGSSGIGSGGVSSGGGTMGLVMTLPALLSVLGGLSSAFFSKGGFPIPNPHHAAATITAKAPKPISQGSFLGCLWVGTDVGVFPISGGKVSCASESD
jgi:hypothetical protein